MKHTGVMIAMCDETTILSLSGRIVRGVGSELLLEVLARSTRPSTRLVIIDMRRVEKLDAAGLDILGFFWAKFNTDEIHLTVVGASPRIAEMLQIAALTELLGNLPPEVTRCI